MKRESRWIAGAQIMVHRLSSDLPGKKVVITANLHGDECTGIGVVQRLLDQHLELQSGELILYPSLNPKGLKERSRYFPQGKTDLNRLFPGKRRGSAAEQHLHHVWNSIVSHRPDVLIDLHTDSGDSIPYLLVDRVLSGSDSRSLEQRCWNLAQGSGIFSVWEYPSLLYRSYRLDCSLAGIAMNKLRIPAMTLEVGPRRRIDLNAVERTLRSLYHWFKALNLIGEDHYQDLIRDQGLRIDPQSLNYTFPAGNWRRHLASTITGEGIFVPSVVAGTILDGGQELGVLYDQHGSILQRVLTKNRVVVLSFSDCAYLTSGQSPATLAIAED